MGNGVTEPPLRVMLVEDQELVRDGLRMVLETSGFIVVAEAGDGQEAIALARALAVDRVPDVVLVDVRMPRMNGIEATAHLTQVLPSAKVVVLTSFDVDEYVFAAVKAGASGFLLKHVSPTDLVRAVRAAHRGDAVVAPALTRRLLDRFASGPPPGQRSSRLGRLSEREVDVVRLVARGLTNTEIGERLYLSEATVKTYVSRVRAKLSLRDRVQVAVFGYESGLVRPGDHDDGPTGPAAG